ncbi:hypothetical protein [Ascidiaceihabitans donghaensis]|nr:hypothetical protein [Ascidiaceihabitans donghaensis]
MKHILSPLRAVILTLAMLTPIPALAGSINQFVGSYLGQADVVLDGETKGRTIRVDMVPKDDGFQLTWTSTSYRDDGDIRESTNEIDFVPSARDNIYGSAMKTNIFGKQVPLDPLKGQPFVWARFEEETFSVFSLAITEGGEYELQEYHRTLADGGLDLLFRSVKNGVPQREITAFLARE